MSLDSAVKDVTLSVRDVLKLVRACRVNGVREFKLGELTLVLGDPEKESTETPHSAAIPRGSKRKAEALSKEVQERFKFSEEQEEVALLLIEDPLEMEKRIENGELIDEVLES
jgi:hypothetical protein